MMDCRKASQLISQSLDQKLSMRVRFTLQFHLLLCKYCSRFSQQLNVLNVAIRNIGRLVENDKNITLPKDTKESIIKAFESEKR